MKVLVTGGAGFIGSHVTEALLNAGYSVTIYDNLSKGYEEYVDKRAHFIKADLADIKTLKDVLNGHDSVIHLAAESIIKDSIDDPEKHLKLNINNAINLLEAMRHNTINKLVFSSSAAVYGETNNSIRENDYKEPLQPYGASKLAIESIISGYFHSFGINCIMLRYFNVYGPRDDQTPVTRAVPNWFKAVLLGKKIPLYWEGKQVRDYIFVSDVARAHILALKNCKGLHSYNIGSGKNNTMLDILESVFEAAGKRTEIENKGKRPGDPHRLIADISKIKKELKWEPQIDLKEGMKKTYQFYINHPESLKRI